VGASGGDTIEVAAGTYNEHDITIDKSLTINGASADTAIVDALQQGRVFVINSGVTVTISNLKITGGKAADGVSRSGDFSFGDRGAEGGGIFNQGTLNLTACVVSNNRAGNGGGGVSRGAGGSGGGISNAGSLTITNSTVSTNFSGSSNGPGGGSSDGSIGGAGGPGGGVFSSGELTITGSKISDNHTGDGGNSTTNAHSGNGGLGGPGGGIFNSGEMTIANSTVNNNQTGNGGSGGPGNIGAAGEGGGISNTGGLIITNSTINSNLTGNGGNALISTSGSSGGIGGAGGGLSNAGTLKIFNVTISNNATGNGGNGSDINGTGGNGGSGGGINNRNELTIASSTISSNQTGRGGNGSNGRSLGSAGTGGGINGTANLRNSIVALNSPNNLSVAITDLGHNITSGDPLLGPLQDNGGPTFTRALLNGSPAIDAGDDCVTEITHCGDPDLPQLTTDQRGTGFPRKSGAHVDIGAFELPSFVIVTVPANQVAEATSAAGAVVTFAPPIAKDTNNISLVATCDHLSGATFPLGITTVQCSATDGASHTGTNSFTVTVRDTTPPTLTLPGALSAIAPNSIGVSVQFSPSPSANDLVSGTVVVSCTPTSGSTFAVGTTPVQCSATDAANNTAQGSFNVTVTLGNTAVGSNVTVQPVDPTNNSTPVTLTFQQIAAPGNTTLTSGSTNPSTQPLPANFKLGSPATFFDISTTASFTPPVKVCISYNGVTYHDESQIKLLHFNALTQHWNDITTPPVDTVNKIVCGSSSSLSPFVLAEANQPPVITVPADQTVEATSASGAVVTYTATATDDFDSSVIVNCSPTSGSTFAIGTTTVQCAATDSAGNAAIQKSFKVTVRDTTPPTIAAPANNTYQCAGQVPAANASQATASDNAGPPVVTISETNNGGAGSTASPLIITRKFTAKDGAGLSASATQIITVKDTTAPTITLIGGDALNHSITVEAKTTFIDPGATASDNCTVNLTNAITKTGSVNTNTVGTYTLTYAVNDGRGNSSSITRTVNVVDTTPPTISCLSPITVDAASPLGAVVTYPLPAASDAVSAVTVNCSQPSGSTFSVGTTPVQCTAKDASQNPASCTFNVTVLGAQAIHADVLSQLRALRAGTTDRLDGNRLDGVIRELTEVVDASLWIDASHLRPKSGQRVFNEDAEIVNLLRQLIREKRSKIADAVLQAFINRLVGADRVLSQVAIKEAMEGRGNLLKMAQSGKAYNGGEEDLRGNRYAPAIEDYGEAWKFALLAIGKL
jgi:hypothetical protein